MAWLEADAIFDPDTLGFSVIGIAAEVSEHDSGEHQHRIGQLLFTRSGCIRITLSGRLCIIPPTRIAWIPPNITHRAEMKGVTGYRSIYMNTSQIKTLSDDIEVLEASPLLREVLEKIAFSAFDSNWEEGPAFNLLSVAIDEIKIAPRESVVLQFPTDRRLVNFLGTDLLPTLTVFATMVGASQKTISRIFIRETGLSYQQWRQRWRFLRSVELLSQHEKISSVSYVMGFSCDSAFIYFFKKMSGQAPGVYMRNNLGVPK